MAEIDDPLHPLCIGKGALERLILYVPHLEEAGLDPQVLGQPAVSVDIKGGHILILEPEDLFDHRVGFFEVHRLVVMEAQRMLQPFTVSAQAAVIALVDVLFIVVLLDHK